MTDTMHMSISISEDGEKYDLHQIGNEKAGATAWLVYLATHKESKMENKVIKSALKDVMELPNGIKTPREMAEKLIFKKFDNILDSIIFEEVLKGEQ